MAGEARFEVVVVGAGVVGLAVGLRLGRAGREAVVVERNPGPTQGENQSSRNSGVIHAGLYYDKATRPLKARLCVRGNELLYDFCARHGVVHARCGKLVVATAQAQLKVLEMYLARARDNGVPARLLPGPEAMEMAPGVRCVGALYLPTSGVIDPTSLVYHLAAQAQAAGVEVVGDTKVVGMEPRAEGVEITVEYRDGARDRLLAARVVNCAGLYADEVARMLEPGAGWEIDPMRGEAACFYRTARAELEVNMNIYPTPHQVRLPKGTYWSVGVHLTPTLEPEPGGRVRFSPIVSVGPLNFAARHKEDFGGELRPMEEFYEKVKDFFPPLKLEDLRPYQAGVQARLGGHQDWVITPGKSEPRAVHLLGIDSPGLTSSLAIAEYVQGMIEIEN